MSKTFYAALKPLPDYSQMVEAEHYSDLPDDWVCILTDVKNSTRAIEEGRYKEVNMIGVATIVAVQNALGDFQFPFIFGGDGATVAVPREELDKAMTSLAHTRQVSREMFGFELRIAIISAAKIRQAAGTLKVAKLAISPQQNLALLRGSGWTLAEKWMKEREAEFNLPADHPAAGEFTGLECRWNPLPARKDEVMALIIQSRVEGERGVKIYRDILREILGPELRPLSQAELKLTWPAKYLRHEARLKVRDGIQRLWYLVKNSAWLMGQVAYLKYRGKQRNIEEPVEYLRELHDNTDYLKFDECLRMVIDVSNEQKRNLLEILDAHVARGEINYGFHCDPNALLTCYIQGPHKHIHFVDAAGGGYAMAAKQLKATKAAQ